MRVIQIDASPKQLSKLRNGHRVRIKKGSGFNLVVSPGTYSLVSRSFSKNKGVDVALSPEEIELNKLYSPESHQQIREEMEKVGLESPPHGAGIFSKIKKGFKKVGKVLKKGFKAAAPVLKPIGHELAKQAIKYVPQIAEQGLTGLAMATGQPELVPLAKVVGQMGGREAQKHLGGLNDKYLGSGLHGHRRHSFHSLPVSDLTLANMEFSKRFHAPPYKPYYHSPLEPRSRGVGGETDEYGSGLYASGRGLFAGGAIAKAEVGLNGGFVRHQPPALQSQPYSANYFFQFQMPPQYQQYERGPGAEFF